MSLPPALASFEAGEEAFYIVYVVPDFDTVQDIPPMTMHPSSGPTLTIDGLAPGNYHVYLFDSPVHLEYRNPAALSALSVQGQQVTVGAGATANLALEALNMIFSTWHNSVFSLWPSERVRPLVCRRTARPHPHRDRQGAATRLRERW